VSCEKLSITSHASNLDASALRLNLGSGPWKKDGWVNVDVITHPDVDVVHDLNDIPWPFADESVERIYACNILEHLADVVQVMEEIWRVLKPSGIAEIIVPYYHSSGAFRDPTHRQFFTEDSMDYFSVNRPLSHYNYYSKCRFEVVHVMLHPIRPYLNLLPRRFLLWLAHNFCTVHSITFRLRKPFS
jgi:ubiquinone/menaquinone biosynthesis C-methylase UbiE